MKQSKTAHEKFNQLRKQAEELMGKKNFAAAPAVFEDPLTLIHELQTLQIELELQNEELHRSQLELMKSQIHYAELYDFAPQGYVTLSLKGVILKSNLTFSDMLSMERKHLINQSLSAHIIFKDQDIYYRHMQKLSDLKTRQICDLRMQKKKGLPFDVHLESTICFNELGDPEQYRTIIIDNSRQKKTENALKKAKEELEVRVKDRTKKLEAANRQLQLEIAERKAYEQEKMKLEEQLRQAQKMEALGTLSSGIAHDFNNILTSIIAFSQLLEMQKFPDTAYMKNSLDQILQSAYQARDLVKQIMMFSRKTEQIKEPVMLDLVIRDVVNMMRASLPSTINIREHMSIKPCIVLADTVQMHQVLMNVCTNAAHAMSTQIGILKIQLDMTDLGPEQCKLMDDIPPGKYAQIMISDTGQGILPENIQKIFDPYFTTKKPGEGTGLGLSVTHGIIKNHGGTILVDSHLGQGTTFKILVPCFFEPDIRAKDASPPPAYIPWECGCPFCG
jgi:signal transduction histidine kinase